ncbi:hypothetical protein VNO77_19967 [Canavalia gladiata]|uniref:Uncharacterized protein n=1 Tax=Canavalia gladiata TaxID=3824 RepID=A0AAN9LTK3_CANGL
MSSEIREEARNLSRIKVGSNLDWKVYIDTSPSWQGSSSFKESKASPLSLSKGQVLSKGQKPPLFRSQNTVKADQDLIYITRVDVACSRRLLVWHNYAYIFHDRAYLFCMCMLFSVGTIMFRSAWSYSKSWNLTVNKERQNEPNPDEKKGASVTSTMAESPESETPPAPGNYATPSNLQTFNETTPFIDYAVAQAQLYHKVFNDAVESAIVAAKSRFSQIRSTSSAHFHQTLHSLDDLKSQYNAYEDLLFGKIKEGVEVAVSHPVITCGATATLGLLVLKRPRQVLYYNTLRLFVSEESLISRAHAEVKELRQSIDLLKAESEKLEKSALHAEEQFLHGRTKLRQAGKQIRNVIHSAHKIERRAGGLKDILGELPKREASHFRSQVSKLASEAKKEKNNLTKEISKISNYGISV